MYQPLILTFPPTQPYPNVILTCYLSCQPCACSLGLHQGQDYHDVLVSHLPQKQAAGHRDVSSQTEPCTLTAHEQEDQQVVDQMQQATTQGTTEPLTQQTGSGTSPTSSTSGEVKLQSVDLRARGTRLNVSTY